MLRLFPLIVALILALPALGQTRHALVVGIDRYAHVVPLQRAVNDARAVAVAMTEAGFEVDLQTNSGETTLLTAISDLAGRAGPGDEVVVYFAGHGIEIDGQNYLLPADIPALEPGQELIIRRRSIPVADIIGALSDRQVRVSLLILDACRNNPFPQRGTRSAGGTRGLARVEAPVGTFVLFSAGAGELALDRLGDGDPDPNSVFTRVLLPRLRQPGLDLRAMVQEVRSEVRQAALGIGHVQFPAVYDQLDGAFVLRAATAVAVAAPAPAAAAPAILNTTGMTAAQMFNRGYDYAHGRGVPRNDSEAVRWYRAAATAGDASGMNNLGWMYREGRGVAQNDSEAVRWFRAAVEAGSNYGMNSLAEMYEEGRGVARDPAVAARWYLAAERLGDRWFRENVSARHSETIRSLHRLLRAAGHYRGALDASWGPASLTALDAYVARR